LRRLEPWAASVAAHPSAPAMSVTFGGNNARLYNIQPKRAMLDLQGDRFATMKADYEKAGPEPSHTRYGYVVLNGPIDHSVFA